ncbi:hypothetical protein [Citrobacter sp. Res13-Sevr-PEB04-36]|uniref:hypothetical protein n=1 Tax=Citrobacter sp. Res13-Sevr-PEB04-36 TaxID=2777960 RepID=UPI0018ACA208|nr:hypothetical protein [Citrobacter sp. Res13-Sevr-PEB04-36]
MPDNIVVGFFDGLFVTGNTVQTEDGKRLTGNTLYLLLTYMALLALIGQYIVSAYARAELESF